MKNQIEEIINNLTNYSITKKNAVFQLLNIINKNSNIFKNDYVIINDVHGYRYGKVINIKTNEALVKLDSGTEYWIPKYMLKKIVR